MSPLTEFFSVHVASQVVGAMVIQCEAQALMTIVTVNIIALIIKELG